MRENEAKNGSTYNTSFDKPSILIIPTEVHSSHGNHALVCESSRTPMGQLEKKMQFKNGNDRWLGGLTWDNITDDNVNPSFVNTPLLITCPHQAPYLEPLHLNRNKYYWERVVGWWRKGLNNDGDVSERAKEKGNNSFELKNDPSDNPYLILLRKYNPLTPFYVYRKLRDTSKANQGIFPFQFYPFIEWGMGLGMVLDTGDDLKAFKEKYDKKVNEIMKSPHFYKLSRGMQSDIKEFQNTKLFDPIHTTFLLSSFRDILPKLKHLKLPIIPGMTYIEIQNMLLRLLMWGWVQDGKGEVKSNNSSSSNDGKKDEGNGNKTWNEYWKDIENGEEGDGKEGNDGKYGKLIGWLKGEGESGNQNSQRNKRQTSTSSTNNQINSLSTFKPFSISNTDPFNYSTNPLSYILATVRGDLTLGEAISEESGADGDGGNNNGNTTYKEHLKNLFNWLPQKGKNGNSNDELGKVCENGTNGRARRSNDKNNQNDSLDTLCPNLALLKENSSSGNPQNLKLHQIIPPLLTTWIQGNYYKKENNSNSSSKDQLPLIPSKDGGVEGKNLGGNSNGDRNKVNEYYGNGGQNDIKLHLEPDSWKTVFEAFHTALTTSLREYISALEKQRNEKLINWINENRVFSLGFLLSGYVYGNKVIKNLGREEEEIILH